MNITSEDIAKQLVEEAGLNQSENVNLTLADGPVMRTFELNPRYATITRSINSTASASGADIIPAIANKRFIVNSIWISFVKDATSDMTNCGINIKQNNASVQVLLLLALPTTAEVQNSTISFPKGLMCDENTSVQYFGTFTAGTRTLRLGVSGYYIP